MKIGIVSDTHGNMGAVEAVAEAASDVEIWLHAGDLWRMPGIWRNFRIPVL